MVMTSTILLPSTAMLSYARSPCGALADRDQLAALLAHFQLRDEGAFRRLGRELPGTDRGVLNTGRRGQNRHERHERSEQDGANYGIGATSKM